MNADRFATRIESLDPESRAIVELAIGRGFSDEDLAGMLGTSVERVGERRERALESLGVSTARGRDALAAELRGDGPDAPVGPGAPAAGDPAAAAPADEGGERSRAAGTEPSAARGERPPRRRALALAIVGGLLVAVAVGVTLALAGGDAVPEPISSGQAQEEGAASGETEPGGQAGGSPEDAAPPADAVEPAAVELQPPAGGQASGTVALLPAEGDRGRRLLLEVRGLGPRRRAGGYGVWLYNSVSDARLVGGSSLGSFRAQVRLPAAADRYRFLDVSYEPPDDNRNHSGASRLRVPLAEVLGG